MLKRSRGMQGRRSRGYWTTSGNIFGEEITIKQAAELCFYSESHFMKYFKQYAGMPFIQYLNDYRLTRAGEFLQNTEESVTQIALKCGFENLSYFNRLFRRKFGVTPGQYRGEKEQPGSWEQPERQESVMTNA